MVMIYRKILILLILVSSIFYWQPLAAANLQGKISLAGNYNYLANNFLKNNLVLDDPLPTNNWLTTVSSALNFSTTESLFIRSYISLTYDLVSLQNIDQNKMLFTSQKIALDKLYLKIRLPWFNKNYCRLQLGKMPLAWGQGLIFNAGDLVFGPLPASLLNSNLATSTFSSSENSLADLRAQTAWLVSAFLPLGKNFSFEPLIEAPLAEENEITILSQNQTTTVTATSGKKYVHFGGRFLWTPYFQLLEVAELSCLAKADNQEVLLACGFDGNLYFDYNFCAQIDFFTKDQAATTILPAYQADYLTKRSLAFSASLAKIYTFTNQKTGIDHPLTLRMESLYYPFEKNIFLYTLISYGFTDRLHLGFNYFYTHQDEESLLVTQQNLATPHNAQTNNLHNLGLSFTAQTLSNLEFNFSANIAALPKFADGISLLVEVAYRW